MYDTKKQWFIWLFASIACHYVVVVVFLNKHLKKEVVRYETAMMEMPDIPEPEIIPEPQTISEPQPHIVVKEAIPTKIPEAIPENDPAPILIGEGNSSDGFSSGTGTSLNTPPKQQNIKAPSQPKNIPKPTLTNPDTKEATKVFDESELSVKPNIQCSAKRIAYLYPQTAIDNDIEADIPVEVIVDMLGRITNPHAKIDPGFGLREASEQALLIACRPSAIPRDNIGNPVSVRVVHVLHFQLE